jgi:hypothetical protein
MTHRTRPAQRQSAFSNTEEEIGSSFDLVRTRNHTKDAEPQQTCGDGVIVLVSGSPGTESKR